MTMSGVPSQAITSVTFDTHSAEETMAAGHSLAKLLIPGLALILRGDIGAGKTTLVKGIAEAMQATGPVTSPTFTLVHEYEAVLRGTHEPVVLYHLDLYRLDHEQQLATLGLDEMLDSGNIVLIEWGEKFSGLVARVHGEIVLTHAGGDNRHIAAHWKL